MDLQRMLYREFLETAFDNGNYATDDVIAFVIPLFEEVLSFHEARQVAPFEQEATLFITDNRIDIDEHFAHAPSYALTKIKSLTQQTASKQFDVVGTVKVNTDVDNGSFELENLQVHLNNDEPLQYAAFVSGYTSFEILLGHHDELTDIFCLGLILGSMALALDLYDAEDLKLFATYRTNPAQYNPRIHATISALITEMTELDREKRCSDLYDVIQRLQHYRDYDPEKQTDLSNVAGWINKECRGRSHFILNKLRNRLFDTSRRNRLLYYKPNMRFVNLTVSSVPMVLHYQSIKPELLFTWNKEISARVTGMKEFVLNKYLRFEDHPYLPSSLDKIRVEAQHDKQEYGFSQLKMVIAFLNWHNLKENVDERIQSPLLLIPVEIKKTKRLKEDHYTLHVQDNVAEVNPVLSNFLKELYGIKLPDFVDLDDMSVEEFYQLLKAQIDEAKQGIVLNYIDKPRIRLVHSVAKQTVTNFRKRLRKREGQLESYHNISYSYQPEHYKPLGLEIFRQRIEPKPSYLEFLVNDDITMKTSKHHFTGTDVKERELYQLTDSESNPYSWDFDVCNMALGNFNYKKMSLVRDYNNIADNNLEHRVFESLFSDQPKKFREPVFDLNKPDNWFHVITADPTQTKAVLFARSGESYIIQGPPGTGKSQTITNLIADFVARGKSILFVCEKRAALDVVYYRLKQQGLDELCCYIHDSQGDKRAFVKNLKTTYDDFAQNKMDLGSITLQRRMLLQKVNEQLEILKVFHNLQKEEQTSAGLPVRKLLEKVIQLQPFHKQLSAKEEELLPGYHEWLLFGNHIQKLSAALEENGADAAFAEHPFSKIQDAVFTKENPVTLLENMVQESKLLLQQITTVVKECNIDSAFAEKFEQVKNLIQDAILLNPLAEHNNLQLVDISNKEAKEFDKAISHYKQKQKIHQQTKDQNNNWKHRFSEQDVNEALSVAEKNEKSFFGFLNGTWRRLKKQLTESYDFSAHQVKPSYSSILQKLKAEYDAANELAQHKATIEDTYRIDNLDTVYLGIELLRNKKGDREVDYLLQHPQANEVVKRLYKSSNTLHQLETLLHQLLHDADQKSITGIFDELETVLLNIDSFGDLLPALRTYNQLSPDLKKALRTISLSPLQAEAAIAFKTLKTIYRENRSFADTDWQVIEYAVTTIQSSYKQLLKLNAAFIRANIRNQFLQHFDLSNMALSQLNADQKQFKKTYSEGRKILENEMSKSMRFKSIRELASKESGLVLKDLKPVWLMSPLSVSDSLPLDTQFFDVIIFDEASQITLEEGVPALYRAPQTIIVGDDKQMPPTNFFTAKADDPDDLEAFTENEDDELLSNDADSLLVQGARKLNSTMLSWHYRSRYETLISYSNHAFYEAGLLTIPDKTIHHTEKQGIEITNAGDAEKFADALFDRSMSFHYLPDSIYEKRGNADEAAYIAQLVKNLLQKGIKESIGIVAFSQEQQNIIEDALATLAATDKLFEQLLEEAYNRTEEDQFVGLFVKNLENVQGDERDIIIMSVCYGFDSRKKMIMNFGPINKKGGEKRLNVIFSRAKKHMAVVSSIRHYNITNEYNEGASYFKRFLHYTEMVSNGNMQLARTILDSLVVKTNTTIQNQKDTTIILKEIRQQLTALGYHTTEYVGQSSFKCSLAVKLNDNDDAYTLSILVDDEQHYDNENLLEQYFQRPAILQSFGWRIIQVFAKDWLQQPSKVMEQIIKRLKEKPVETEQENYTVDFTATTTTDVAPEPIKPSAATPLVTNASTPYDHLSFIRLEFVDAVSAKFWEAATDAEKLVVRFGKVNTKGQTQVKTFADINTAEKERQKLIADKTAKGYKRV